MAIITLTEAQANQIARMSWGQQRNDTESRSIFGAQALEVSGPLWVVDFSVIMQRFSTVNSWKSTLLQLKGKVNQFEMWDTTQPRPLGTMRGVMTLNADAAQGATSLSITAGVGQAGKTLLEGDCLQLGSGANQQVVMLTADATADVSGVIAVTVQPPLRNAFASAAAVTWDKPKALFRRTDSRVSWSYEASRVTGIGLSLLEDPRP